MQTHPKVLSYLKKKKKKKKDFVYPKVLCNAEIMGYTIKSDEMLDVVQKAPFCNTPGLVLQL